MGHKNNFDENTNIWYNSGLMFALIVNEGFYAII